MSVIHDEAVCLRHREWSETSQTVILLTRHHGLVNGLAKGSRRERANFSGGFELLQFGELGFVLRPDKDLVTLTDWDLTNPFIPLRSRYTASVAAMFAAELTVSLLAPGDPHPRVFAALLEMLERSTSPRYPEPVADCRPLTAYLVALLNDTGQFPDLSPRALHESSVYHFDPSVARLIPSMADATVAKDLFGPGHGQQGHWPVRTETIAILTKQHDDPTCSFRTDTDSATWTRAARFLAAWAAYRSGRRPSSLDAFLRITRL